MPHAVSHDGGKAVSVSHRRSQGIRSLAAFHADLQPVFLFLYLCVFLHSQVPLAFISESFMNSLVWTGLPLGICTCYNFWGVCFGLANSIVLQSSKSCIIAPNLCALCVPCGKSLQLCLNLCHPMDWSVDQASLSMGFSKQEYWRGLLCPPPEDLSDPGIELVSLISPALAGVFFTICSTWEAL